MLFDVQAALTEILTNSPACCDPCDSRDSIAAQSRESQKSRPAPVKLHATEEITLWSERGYAPEAIRQGVPKAFEDWQAMNDPYDTRAWA